MEIWKDIEGYEGLYQVSNLGRVRSWIKCNSHPNIPRIMKLQMNKKGYLVCPLSSQLGKKLYKVHRLVANAFILNTENKPQINHLDGNKQNNKVENLEWCTASENQIHANKIGLTAKRKECHLNKTAKKVYQYNLNNNFVETYKSASEAARKTNISQTAISACCRHSYGFKTAGGFIWKYAEEVMKNEI